jgi:hypothetical protein
MNYLTLEYKLLLILKQRENTTKSFQIEMDGLSFSEVESLRYQLLSRNIRAEIYSEFKKVYLGIFI